VTHVSQTQGRLTLDGYVAGVLAGDRTVLGRAITLVESERQDHQELAQELLGRLLPETGRGYRVGITGVPGVGKSTFIEVLGTRLTAAGHRVAVLAVDPTSSVSRGSILGDKTRMERLARDPLAFIRPSPTGGSLGGVGRKTRETILVCEAAGFDVVLVETVGVGQSETLVAQMVDFFMLLMLPGAGDELQGIKRGIMELADLVAITKADGANAARAMEAQRQFAAALRLLTPHGAPWQPAVLSCSALEGTGIEELWAKVEEHRGALEARGELQARRREQRVRWMWSMVEDGLLGLLRNRPGLAALAPDLETAVAAGTLTPTAAARRLLGLF
jgi:GTPase